MNNSPATPQSGTGSLEVNVSPPNVDTIGLTNEDPILVSDDLHGGGTNDDPFIISDEDSSSREGSISPPGHDETNHEAWNVSGGIAFSDIGQNERSPSSDERKPPPEFDGAGIGFSSSGEAYSSGGSSSGGSPPAKIPKYETNDGEAYSLNCNNESNLTSWHKKLIISRLEQSIYFIQDPDLLKDFPELDSILPCSSATLDYLELNLEDAMNSCVEFCKNFGNEEVYQQYTVAMKKKFNSYLQKRYISSGEESFINDIPEQDERVLFDSIQEDGLSDKVKHVLGKYGYDNVDVVFLETVPEKIATYSDETLGELKNDDCPSHLKCLLYIFHFPLFPRLFK